MGRAGAPSRAPKIGLMATNEEMSRSFGAAVDHYDAGRPDYPVEAIAWLLEPVRTVEVHDERPDVLRIADVGAGTGKLTRLLTANGAEVTAIEPDSAMRARLTENLPGVRALAGTAEALPLPDDSVDAVFFGQSWHWVNVDTASAEAARVLRPGGVLALVWNIRDERTPWVAEMGGIMHRSTSEKMMGSGGPRVAAPFAALEEHRWEWDAPMTRPRLWDMVRSRSYIITAEPAERGEIESRLDALFDRIGADGFRQTWLPYVTSAYRAIRP